ncbi:MAG: hypothetical protein J5697_00285 [Clostridia bacterium]|nr:hypothetical protein [Clostridia bacterium]
MNSLGREGRNSEEKKGIFTKETFGVVIMLFSALSLVLVITRGAVFGMPGVWVNSFFFGCFGYFSFILCAYLFYLGFSLLTEKKLPLSKRIKVLAALFIAVLAVLTQTISVKATGTYGEYIGTSYSMGGGGIKTSSCGGAVAGLVAFWTQKLLSAVGSYVVFGALLALITYFIVKTVMAERGGKPTVEKFRSSYEKPQPATVNDTEATTETPVPTETATAARQRLFIAGEETFAFKGKKEAAKSDPVKMEFEKGGLGVASYGSYRQNYENDLQEKINYVKTPKVIEINDINGGSATNGAPVVSDYISPNGSSLRQESITPAVPENKEENFAEEIPFIEHGEEEKEGTDRAATSFEEYANVEEVEPTVVPTEPEEQFTEYVETEGSEENAETEEEIAEAFSIKEDEELPPSNINRRRSREILFGDEEEKPENKEEPPAFTSRVTADSNENFTLPERRSVAPQELTEPVAAENTEE